MADGYYQHCLSCWNPNPRPARFERRDVCLPAVARNSHRHCRELLLGHLQHGRGQEITHGRGIGLDPARLWVLRHPDSSLGFGSSEFGFHGLHPILQQRRLEQSWAELLGWHVITRVHFAWLVTCVIR